MSENNDHQKEAKERDNFMNFKIETLNAFNYGEIEKASSSLLDAAQNYAIPENNNIDLELARFLFTIDEKSSSQFLQFINTKKQDFSNSKLPQWARDYIEEICSGFAPSDDERRLSFFRKLSISFSQSSEPRFLLAIALTKSAIDEKGNEKKFKEALSIYKKIQNNLSPESKLISIWRTGSLGEQSPHIIVIDFYNWTLKNYVYQLQYEDRSEEAIKLLEKMDVNSDSKLLSLLDTLESECRIINKFEEKLQKQQEISQEKLQKQQEIFQNKHFEILTIFLVLITIVLGGLLPLFSTEISYNSLVKFSLILLFVMPLCLSFLTNDKFQRYLRAGIGITCLIALLFLCYFDSAKDTKNQPNLSIKKEHTT